MEQLRRFLANSIVFSVGDFLVRGLGLILLPLYTRFLTTEDYGILGITTLITSVMQAVFMWGFQSALMRAWVDVENDVERRQELVSTLLIFQLIVSALCAALVTGIVWKWHELLFRNIPFRLIIMAVWIAYFASIQRSVPQALLRIREQSAAYSVLTVITFLLNVSATIAFVVYLRLGAFGSLLGTISAASIMSVAYVLYVVRKDLRPVFSQVVLRDVWAYSSPLILQALLWSLLGFSDRYLLERFVSLSDIGLYTLAYQLAVALQVIVFSTNSAWRAFFFRAVRGDEREQAMIPKMATMYVAGMVVLTWCIIIFAPEVITVLTPPTYHPAIPLVPWVVAGVGLLTFYQLWADALISAKRSRQLPFATGSALVVSIVLNLLLIPRFGLLAAAINTLISYIVLSSLAWLFARQIRPIPHQYIAWLKLLTIATLTGALAWNLPASLPLVASVALKSAILLTWPVALLLTGIVTSSDLARLRGIVERRRSARSA